jgi:hypothetical protein
VIGVGLILRKSRFTGNFISLRSLRDLSQADIALGAPRAPIVAAGHMGCGQVCDQNPAVVYNQAEDTCLSHFIICIYFDVSVH